MIGIIGAMQIEVDALKKEMANCCIRTISGVAFYSGTLWGQAVVVAVSGIGKVNAAICAQTMILTYSPTVIINSGVAGGVYGKVNIGDIVIGTSMVQHDFQSLDAKKGWIQEYDLIHFPCSKTWINRIEAAAATMDTITIKCGIIATGDQFMNDKVLINEKALHFDAMAFEMEGASIAYVCYVNNVDCAVIRSISDNGDDDATVVFYEFLQIAVDHSLHLLEKLFHSLPA
jgi:adenosylhomocysteine nucleosidase